MTGNDLFRWTLVASIIFHLVVVLGISFVIPAQAEKPVLGPPLRITLVASVSESAPDETGTLAQADSLGEEDAGTLTPAARIQNPEPAARQRRRRGDEDQFMNDASRTADLSATAADRNETEENAPSTRDQIAESVNLAYMNAQSQPREKYVSARSKESKYAAYIEKWRLLVERVGNLNYPEAAKQQKLEGALVLDVAITADGNVDKVRVLQSSGIKALDDAAERIVHIAAPFDRFPDGIRSETDTLHIVRTWEFRQSRLTARIPKNK